MNVFLSVDSVRAIIETVKLTHCLGLVPAYLIVKELKEGVLRVVGGNKKKHYVNRIALAQVPGKKRSLAERVFEARFYEMYGKNGINR